MGDSADVIDCLGISLDLDLVTKNKHKQKQNNVNAQLHKTSDVVVEAETHQTKQAIKDKYTTPAFTYRRGQTQPNQRGQLGAKHSLISMSGMRMFHFSSNLLFLYKNLLKQRILYFV